MSDQFIDDPDQYECGPGRPCPERAHDHWPGFGYCRQRVDASFVMGIDGTVCGLELPCPVHGDPS